MSVPADSSLVDWLAGIHQGQAGMLDTLNAIHEDLHWMVSHQAQTPESWPVPVSTAHPLFIDRRGMHHLYIWSPVPIELFYTDVASQLGNPNQSPWTVSAANLMEVPFATGDKLTCPGIAEASEVIVMMLASNSSIST